VNPSSRLLFTIFSIIPAFGNFVYRIHETPFSHKDFLCFISPPPPRHGMHVFLFFGTTVWWLGRHWGLEFAAHQGWAGIMTGFPQLGLGSAHSIFLRTGCLSYFLYGLFRIGSNISHWPLFIPTSVSKVGMFSAQGMLKRLCCKGRMGLVWLDTIFFEFEEERINSF
jgi:hypothetical protein